MNLSKNGETSSAGNNNGDTTIEVSNGAHTRFARIDFPTFSGEDPTSWLYKVNIFFTYYNTPHQQR